MNPTANATNPGTRINPDDPPYAEMRELLQAAFTPDEFHRLCKDDPEFRPLIDRFPANPSLLDMIDKLFEYRDLYFLWERLLDGVARQKPRQYNRFAARMGWPQVPLPAPAQRAAEAAPPAVPPDQEPEPAEEAAPPPPGDVEIHVGAGSEGRYPVTIQTQEKGQDTGILEQLPPADRLREWLVQLEGGQADRARQAEIGQALFRALFPEAIRDRYMSARDETVAGVRLRLWIDAPDLQGLPWELLYDAADDEFLALSGRALVTRYLPVPRGAPPLAVTTSLRVLVATASPKGPPPLAVEAEAAAVQEALAQAEAKGLAQVEILPHAHVMTLRAALRDYRPHVLHFAGHGEVGPDGGALLLEDEAGGADPLSARGLRIMIQRSGADVRLAVLNACLTARGTPAEAGAFDAQRRALLGAGPMLVRAGLGAVVAMQFSLSEASAHLFARDFYDTVARLEPVDLAVSRAREALALKPGTGSRDWATPVLFFRARDGVIFRQP